MSDVIVVGLNHKTAPVEIRERLAITGHKLDQALGKLRRPAELSECLILSTCNRVEIYGTGPAPTLTIDSLASFLQEHGAIEPAQLAPHLYAHRQPASIQHLFRVASGMDSMILGETEITGQVKDAYAVAHGCGATGKILNTLFQRALNTAKEVRTRTSIGCGAISVGSVAVELAEKIFGQLNDCRIFLVGAGDVGELVLRHLTERGATRVMVASRTLENAMHLAEEYRGRATSMDRVHEELRDADIVIAATRAPHAVITRDIVEEALKERRQRPLFFIDLAVPRNVDPLVGRIDNVYLYDIDDLQSVAAGNQREREQAMADSSMIVQRKVDLFLEWMQRDQTSLPYRHARQHIS